MSLINHEAKTLHARVVYVGPAGSGKSTCVRYLWERTRTPGSEVVRPADAPHAGMYDVLPMKFGDIRGFAVHFELVTVPGGDAYLEKRRELLTNPDGLVFVADASPGKESANATALEETRMLLASHGFSLGPVPYVVQANKRDVAGSSAGSVVMAAMGAEGVFMVESVATSGVGVFDALKGIAKRVLAELSRPAAT